LGRRRENETSGELGSGKFNALLFARALHRFFRMFRANTQDLFQIILVYPEYPYPPIAFFYKLTDIVGWSRKRLLWLVFQWNG
jgi:hypothetical protein